MKHSEDPVRAVSSLAGLLNQEPPDTSVPERVAAPASTY